MIQLTEKDVGLILTGARDQLTPRQEYEFNSKGRYHLAEFFILSPQIFLGAIPRTIWLTPAILEDLLIYFAFVKHEHKYVFIDEEKETRTRTLFAFNDSQQAKRLFEENKNVLVNPSLLHLH